MAVDLKNHPGLNPEYFGIMERRKVAISENRKRKAFALANKIDPRRINLNPVPKQPNKYVPHIGAKQRSKPA